MDQEQTAYQAGVRLGAWLATEARPQLARWAGSADRRVRLQALVLSGIIEARVDAEDWPFLADLREQWEGHAIAVADDAAQRDGSLPLPLEAPRA